MTRQIALPLKFDTLENGDRFILSAANRDAAELLEARGNWPDNAALLLGPPRSGKSLLSRLASERSAGALHVEDDWPSRPDRDETALFHALNRARDGGAPLLLTAEQPPATWDIRIPDLRSRLIALPMTEISVPDDELAAELLSRYFALHGFRCPPDVAGYLLTRVERSYASLEQVSQTIAEAAGERARTITVRLVSGILNG